MRIKYHHVDPESHNFVILRDVNFELHSRPPIIKEYDILIMHDINIYRNARPQNFDDIVAKYSDL
jgi:hypothetical protein